MATVEPAAKRGHFIRHIVEEDLASGKHATVVTRFPPEPNGYLHIGHAKALCLDFGMAKDYGGRCHLRFDDTSPEKEDLEYVRSIQEDIRWLGWDWGPHLYHTSDYFQKIYDLAEDLVRAGTAYVCSLTPEQVIEYRGTLTEPGKPSPDRNRPAAESLDLLRRMRAGEFLDGKYTLRATIDMASPNILMRDPILYRIRHASHWRTKDAWCIYPTYDYSHPICDALEGITHSLCSLEYEVHRPLYDWVLDHVGLPSRPRQIEFARLNLQYAVMSKRKLLQLVKEGRVSGWDDPRLHTLCGLRRRGYPPAAIRTFCEDIGMAKATTTMDLSMLEASVRDELNTTVPRAMAVLDPLKVTITNYPADQREEFEAPNFPDEPLKMGHRKIPFGRTLYVEREDFQEAPSKDFYRLAPGREVRLRWAYLITCQRAITKDGAVVELECTYDPATRGGTAPDGRKVKGTIHWVDAETSRPAPVRIYDRLFALPDPEADGKNFLDALNPDSLKLLSECRVERHLAAARPGECFQFERKGYFVADAKDSKPGAPVFNRVVTLREAAAKAQGDRAAAAPAAKAPKPAPAPKPPKKPLETPAEIPFEDFWKVKLVVAQVKACERVKGADKLLQLVLDAGPEGQPTVLAGLAHVYAPEQLVGRRVLWVANLAPRTMCGVRSQGMVLAADTDGGGVAVVEPAPAAALGTRAH